MTVETVEHARWPRPTSPRWRGVNHLALVTADMDATTRFYAGVLGARLVATVGTPAFRHYFFEFGTNSTLAFFEYRDVEPDRFAKPAGIPVPEAAQFDHLSSTWWTRTRCSTCASA